MFTYEKYEPITLGEICVFLRNGAQIKQTTGAGGIPITRIETLSNDVFNTDRMGYAGIKDSTPYEKYLLKDGDILISHINSTTYLGRAVQYHNNINGPVIHGMNLLCARIKPTLDPTYVEWFFKTKEAHDYIESITKKAVHQASISISDLKNMLLPFAPLSDQQNFSGIVKQADKSKFVIQQSL